MKDKQLLDINVIYETLKTCYKSIFYQLD